MPEAKLHSLESASHEALRLLAAVSSRGKRQLDEVETDLVQMDILLGEAIGKLGTSFLSIHEALGQQRRALDALLAGGMPTAEGAAAVDRLGQEIDRHIQAAVTGLQFQDLTSQLSASMTRHLAQLRGLLAAVGSGAADLASGEDDVFMQIERASCKVAEMEAAAASALKPVGQRHMESGDIELFEPAALPAAGCGA